MQKDDIQNGLLSYPTFTGASTIPKNIQNVPTNSPFHTINLLGKYQANYLKMALRILFFNCGSVDELTDVLQIWTSIELRAIAIMIQTLSVLLITLSSRQKS